MGDWRLEIADNVNAAGKVFGLGRGSWEQQSRAENSALIPAISICEMWLEGGLRLMSVSRQPHSLLCDHHQRQEEVLTQDVDLQSTLL